MHITHDARDLLVIHSAATVGRVLGGIIAVIGLLVCVGGPCMMARRLMDEMVARQLMDERTLGQAILEGVAIVAGGLVIVGAGALVYWLGMLRDADYRFDGKDLLLTVSRRSGARTILFTRIIKAEVFDGGDDSVAWGVRLRLRDPSESLDLTDFLRADDALPKMFAERINRFLKAYQDEYDDVSIDLKDANVGQMAAVFLENLLHGLPATPTSAAAPARRDGPVLFVCPECGWQTTDPDGPPPYECPRCGDADKVVNLQDRTPGRTLVVACACGASFAVPVSFAGMMRPCPKCGEKCQVDCQRG